jgi:hypothetical protein
MSLCRSAAWVLAGTLLAATQSWALYAKPKDKAGETNKTPLKEPKEIIDLLAPNTNLIDVPTAGVIDTGGFTTRTRFFSEGGIMQWLDFGVYPRINLGVSFNVDRFIGASSQVQMTRPDLQFKLRFYDGDHVFPALALGFDGQGYLYNRMDRKYNQRQKGIYFIGTQEIGLPGLQGHIGANISDFDSNAVFGMTALSYNIGDKVEFLLEWDNLRSFMDSRVNMGFRVFLMPNFHIGFAARGIGQSGVYSNGVSRGPERIVQLQYSANF